MTDLFLQITPSRSQVPSTQSSTTLNNDGDLEKGDCVATVQGHPPGRGTCDVAAENSPAGTMTWWKACTVTTAATSSIGMLSLPKAITPVGLGPGVALIVVLGVLTTYTGLVIYELKMRYPKISSYVDALEKATHPCARRYVRWIAVTMQTLVLIFIMSAHVVAFGEQANSFRERPICSMIFMGMGAGIMFGLAQRRNLKDNWFLAGGSLILIVSAIIVGIVGVPAGQSDAIHWYAATPLPLTSFGQWFQAISSILFVYMGHIAYPTVISEMNYPKEFPTVLKWQMGITVALSLTVVGAFYCLAGQDVTPIALSSARVLFRQVAFGLAIPAVIVPAVIFSVVAARPIYLMVWTIRGNVDMTLRKGFRARSTWAIITGLLWGVASTAGYAIPNFQQIVPLVGAAFAPSYCLCFPAWFWFRMRMDDGRTFSQIFRGDPMKSAIHVLIFALGIATMVLGLYGSIMDILNNPTNHKPFSCENYTLGVPLLRPDQ